MKRATQRFGLGNLLNFNSDYNLDAKLGAISGPAKGRNQFMRRVDYG